MSWRFAKLLEIAVEHPYYAGGAEPPFELLPTDETRATLAANKLLHRPTPTGCVVLYEIDPFDPNEALPVAALAGDLALNFYLVPKSASFSAVTGFDPARRPFVYLDNAAPVAEESLQRLHSAATLSDADLVSLKSHAFTQRILSNEPEIAVALQGPDGRLHQSATLVPEDGAAYFSASLEGAPTGRYTLSVNGVATAEYYVDPDLLRRNAVALIRLKAKPRGSDAGAYLDNNDAPVFRNFLLRFPHRATTWRYVVVTRDYAALTENDLSIADTILVDDNPRFIFQASGPKAPLPSGEEAVVFASTAPIPLSRHPVSGLALRRAGANNSFSNIRENLPNPSPTELSQTSTSANLISDIYVYI